MVRVQRSMPAPSSLAVEACKKDGKYNDSDVTERLEQDFHNKCYICEIKPNADPVVEHRLPHKDGQYPERKFNWNNLFWSCSHCNSVKNKKKYDSGIIDCCTTDPEKRIHQFYDIDGLLKFEAYGTDTESTLTCELLHETFYEENTGIKTVAGTIRTRQAIAQINILMKALDEYQENPDGDFINCRLRALLSKKSSYSSFKRAYVRDRAKKYPQLQAYLED